MDGDREKPGRLQQGVVLRHNIGEDALTSCMGTNTIRDNPLDHQVYNI